MNSLSRVYNFSGFEFDAMRLAIYHRGELLHGVSKKSLEVLRSLVGKPGELISHDEIIAQVWGDNPHGITPAHINQYVSRLQRSLAKYEPKLKIVENLRGRGYTFLPSVEMVAPSDGVEPVQEDASEKVSAMDAAAHSAAVTDPPRRRRGLLIGLGLLTVGIIAIGAAVYFRPAANDDTEVRRVVRESQLFESLVLYKNPAAFKESDLDRYWTTELDVTSNYDRAKIRDSVTKMIAEKRRYGDESKCEQFDFQSVEINKEGDTAIVKTLEHWFISVYKEEELLRNREVGPYFVSYILKKIDGRWLIEKSTTARANLPAPKLASVEPTTPVVTGQQFFVRITGEDFLDEVIAIRLTGEGCPESSPCLVPNSAIRKHSKIERTVIDNVPLTLASGSYMVTAVNGTSQPSNAVALKVP